MIFESSVKIRGYLSSAVIPHAPSDEFRMKAKMDAMRSNVIDCRYQHCLVDAFTGTSSPATLFPVAKDILGVVAARQMCCWEGTHQSPSDRQKLHNTIYEYKLHKIRQVHRRACLS